MCLLYLGLPSERGPASLPAIGQLLSEATWPRRDMLSLGGAHNSTIPPNPNGWNGLAATGPVIHLGLREPDIDKRPT